MTRLPTAFLDTPLSHRTLHDVADGRPENSFEGAEAALAAGYGIEIDLQLSRDGVPMVFHDYDLGRLTDQSGAVAQRRADELQAITLRAGQAGIPTLAAFLDLVAGRVPLLIELKDQDGALGPAASALEAATCDLLQRYTGPVALMSFNPHVVFRCASLAPHIARGLVTDPFHQDDWGLVPAQRLTELARIPDYDRVGASFLSHNVSDLGSPKIAELKSQGADILCWTVRNADQERKARRIAQNITFEGYVPLPPA